MQGKHVVYSVYVLGTLAADLSIAVGFPTPCTLQHVSMSNSTGTPPNVQIGSTSDADAYMVNTPVGENGNVVEVGPSGMVGGFGSHVDEKGVVIAVDHDAGGGDGADLVICLSCVED